MAIIGELLLFLLSVFYWIIIIQVVLSWLVAFDVININNGKARNLIVGLNKLTEPVYRPLRKFIPSIGGIDLSPIIIILGIFILQSLVRQVFFGI